MSEATIIITFCSEEEYTANQTAIFVKCLLRGLSTSGWYCDMSGAGYDSMSRFVWSNHSETG